MLNINVVFHNLLYIGTSIEVYRQFKFFSKNFQVPVLLIHVYF